MTTRTVLVVDDAAMERLKLTFALKKLGHAVIEASNGIEALSLAASGGIDVILLDLLMPEMDGFETLSRLKANPDLSQIPVIVVSSLEGQEDIDRARGLGAIAHLGKPMTSEALMDALNF